MARGARIRLMGVLDRLDKEARDARQLREATARAQSRHEGAAMPQLESALDRAQRYLQSLAAHLTELNGSVLTRYEIEGLGVLEHLRQESYRVARTADQSGSVALQFNCIGRKPIEVSIEGHASAKSLAKKLRDARLSCRLRPVSERVMQLRVEANIPVRINFVPDIARASVWIELRNLTALGDQRYCLAPDRVDEALLDALASLVLREPSAFARMTSSVVGDDQREDLRRKLLREQRRRDAELAGGLRRLAFPMMEWFRRRFLGD